MSWSRGQKELFNQSCALGLSARDLLGKKVDVVSWIPQGGFMTTAGL